MDTRTRKEILDQWEKVKEDRLRRQACLDETGPGESPYTTAQDQAWDMREHCLARTLLSAMPELESMLSSNYCSDTEAGAMKFLKRLFCRHEWTVWRSDRHQIMRGLRQSRQIK